MQMMRAIFYFGTCVALGISFSESMAQSTAASDTTASDTLLDRTIAANVLTTSGAPPFHAVLEIATEKSPEQGRNGRIEVFWAEPDRYAVNIDTPKFRQRLVVHGTAVQETDEGDFYPAWLQNFVSALLNPMAHAKELRGHTNDARDDPHFVDFCVEHDDRRNNILDAAAYSRICFSKAQDMQLTHILDFTHALNLSDFKPFHAKQIARTYGISTRDNTSLVGTLSALEDWTPNDATLAVTTPTPPSNRILTSMVSTMTEESLLESAPKDVRWPSVHEGTLDGYMIIHAVTDRSGQVREASTYDSANEALGPYGRDLALQYKFKPLLVNGAPQQMEMPLILHFKTVIDNPTPEVDDAWFRKNVKNCKLPTEVNRPSAAGKQVEIILRIRADGKLQGISGGDGAFASYMFREFPSCMLPPVLQNGQASEYIAHLKVMAK